MKNNCFHEQYFISAYNGIFFYGNSLYARLPVRPERTRLPTTDKRKQLQPFCSDSTLSENTPSSDSNPFSNNSILPLVTQRQP